MSSRIFAILVLLVAVAAALGVYGSTSSARAAEVVILAAIVAPLPLTVPFAVGITEAARLMGISRALVYQLINVGELEVVKIGTRTVIRTDVIQRFLAANAGVPDPNLSPLKRAERKAEGTPRIATTPAPIAASSTELVTNDSAAG
jgi:excisionase family DNA binding protein